MSNLICYSLDQESIKYLEIIKYNINFVKFFLPNWKIRFYLKSKNEIKNKISNFSNCELIFFDTGSIRFAKFLPLLEKDKVERFLVRDYKTFINSLEINMIEKWIKSKKIFHLISTNKKLVNPNLIGINNFELFKKKIQLNFDFKRDYHGICDYFCEICIKPILENNFLSDNKDQYIEFNVPFNIQQFNLNIKDVTYLGELIDPYGELCDKTMIDIESISILCTKNIVHELILLLESINFLYSNNIKIECLCDKEVFDILNKKFLDESDFLRNIKSSITFHVEDFDSKTGNWTEFMETHVFRKIDIINKSLQKYKNTIFIDSDIILFNKLPMVPKNKKVGLCHHYINCKDVESFGAFNAGMIYVSDSNFTDWFLKQKGTDKCRYYEQTVLEYVHTKFETFLFEPQVNFGYWKLAQSPNKNWVYQNFTIKDGKILYQNKNLQSIHTHLLGEHPNILEFNKIIANLIMCSNSHVKDILIKYKLLDLPKLPIFIVHQGNQQYLKQVTDHAKKFNNNIYLIGDNSNKSFVKNHLDINIDNDLENQFQSRYSHFSTNNEPFERICISRWFKIYHYAKKMKLSNFCVMDSDVLIYSDSSEFFYNNIINNKSWFENKFMYLTNKNKNVSCAISFWNINTLGNLCNFIVKFYNNENIKKMQNWWNNYKLTNKGGICDMTLIYYFIINHNTFSELKPKSNKINDGLCQIFNDNSTFDNSFTEILPEYESENAKAEDKEIKVKKIKFINNLPFCYNFKTKKYVKFINLHFHASKELIKKYLINQYKINNKKISNKIKIIIPKSFNEDDLYYHKNDTFREMVKCWSNLGLCEISYQKTNHVWLNKIGDILLYDRPTLDWLEKNLNYQIGLFGNPICPNNGKFNNQWIFWGRKPILIEYFSKKNNFKYDQKKILSIFLGKIETTQQLNNRSKNWSYYIEKFECPVTESKKYKYSQEEYLQLLSQSKFGLCLPGFGNKCNREVELFALGVVPIFTPNVCTKYCFSLKKDENYLLANKPEDIPKLIADCDLEKWNTIVSNNKLIYEKHLSITGSFYTTQKLIQEIKTEKSKKNPKLSVVLFSKNDDYIPDKIKLIKNSKKIKHIVVKPSEISQMIPKNVPQICHVLARNIGLRRSTGDYILSTNIDIIVPSRKEILELVKNDQKDSMFIVSRKDIDSEFTKSVFTECPEKLFNILSNYCNRINREVDRDPVKVFTKYAKSQVEGVLLESHLKYSVIGNCGDFQLASKELWNSIKGFEEGMINSAWGTDSSIQAKVVKNNFKLKISTKPNVYHISHGNRSHGNTPVTNDMYKYFINIGKSHNDDSWGFSNYNFEQEII